MQMGQAKQDAELLFGTQKVAKVQAVTLDKSEMAKTEGGWFWFSPWFYSVAFAATRYIAINHAFIPNTVNSIRYW